MIYTSVPDQGGKGSLSTEGSTFAIQVDNRQKSLNNLQSFHLAGAQCEDVQSVRKGNVRSSTVR